MSRHIVLAFVCCLNLSMGTSAWTAPGDELWWDGFGWAGTSRPIGETIVFDGSLIAAGDGGVYRWTGIDWRLLGELTGVNGNVSISVRALAEFDGKLYVGGFFQRLAGIDVHSIAVWDGITWSAVGAGVERNGYFGNAHLNALMVHDGALLAAGFFDEIDGVPAMGLARWDGTDWSAVDTRTLGEINALGIAGSQLLVGGQFDPAGGTFDTAVEIWDGASWTPVGGALRGRPASLRVFDGDIVLGGLMFTGANHPRAGALRWSGSQWEALGQSTGLTVLNSVPISFPWVESMIEIDSKLHVVGRFDRADGQPAGSLAVWDGTQWSDPGLRTEGSTLALVPHEGNLIVAGDFDIAQGQLRPNVVAWDGNAAQPMGTPGAGVNASHCFRAFKYDSICGDVLSTLPWGGGLVVGGYFDQAGDLPVQNLAHWTGSSWASLGDFTEHGTFGRPQVSALTVWGNLIAAGHFYSADGTPAKGVARYSGGTWQALGSGLLFDQFSGPDGAVNALTPYLFSLAAGGWNLSTESSVNLWDGVVWTPLTGITGSVNALVVYDGELYAGGNYRFEGLPFTYLAKWVPAVGWQPLPSEPDGQVNALTVHGSKLVVGGSFDNVGALSVGGVATWDGSQWERLGDLNGPSHGVRTMVSTGSQLLIGGTFDGVDGVAAPNVALLQGNLWFSLGSGIAHPSDFPAVRTMALLGADAYIGGSFSVAGGKPSYNVGRVLLDVTIPAASARLVGESAPGGVRLEWSLRGIDSDPRVFLMRQEGEAFPRQLIELTAASPPRWFDATARSDRRYRYWLEIAVSGRNRLRLSNEVTVQLGVAPARARLVSVSPNPFNARLRVEVLVSEGAASLELMDVAGRRIRTFDLTKYGPGAHSLQWDGLDDGGKPVASGTYVLRFENAGTVDRKRVTLAK